MEGIRHSISHPKPIISTQLNNPYAFVQTLTGEPIHASAGAMPEELDIPHAEARFFFAADFFPLFAFFFFLAGPSTSFTVGVDPIDASLCD